MRRDRQRPLQDGHVGRPPGAEISVGRRGLGPTLDNWVRCTFLLPLRVRTGIDRIAGADAASGRFAGASAFQITSDELIAGLAGIRRYDLHHEFPDVLNFRDLAESPHLLGLMVARRGWYPSDEPYPPKVMRATTFPYPKLINGIRDMAQLHVVDRLVDRAIVARIGQSIDAALSDRMYANRLAITGPEWTLCEYPQAYGAYHEARLESLRENAWPYTLITDLTRFYPSIRRDVLTGLLRRLGCDPEAVATLGEQLAVWQDRDHLAGLPIGDESFGVISAPVLAPIDVALRQIASDHFFYSDDLTLFAKSASAGRAAKDALDGLVAEAGFKLNSGKTYEYFNPVSAEEAIRNEALDYIDAMDVFEADMTRDRIYALWDEFLSSGALVDPRQRSTVHFVLGRLGRAKDRYAVGGLIRRPDIMQMTPKNAVRYLLTVAADDRPTYAAMLHLAHAPVTPANEALVLHALRYIAERPRDDQLIVPCLQVLDGKAHAPTRAWAAMAYRSAPSWDQMQVLERAEAEPNYWIGRAELASTKGSTKAPRVRRHLLMAIGKERPDMAATCEYALRAA